MKNRAKSALKDTVMQQIKTGKVSMRPKAHFIALAVVSFGAALLAGITTAYLFSIALLWIRIQSSDTMAWGARYNLAESIASFPWWIAIASVLFLVIAIFLVRKHSHLYKYRISELILVIVLASFILGMAFSLFDIGRPHTPAGTGERGFGPNKMRNY